jgi:hypothetical protein
MARKIPLNLVIIGAACVAVLAILAVVLYLPSATSSVVPPSGPEYHGLNVVVTDVDFMPDYYTTNNSEVGYLTTPYCYPTRNASCPATGGYLASEPCPNTGCVNVTPGSEFTYELQLINNGTVYHTVSEVILGSPFTLVSTSPTLPVKLKPDAHPTDIVLTVDAPSTAGLYDFSGTVNCE